MVEANITVRFHTTLGDMDGDGMFLQFDGSIVDVQRAVIQALGMDAGSMNAPLSDVVTVGGHNWVQAVHKMQEASSHARAVDATLTQFPSAQVVNDSNGRMVGEAASPSVEVEPKHPAFVKALGEVLTSMDAAKLGRDYAATIDHDPELLQQMRARYAQLAAEEKAGKKAA